MANVRSVPSGPDLSGDSTAPKAFGAVSPGDISEFGLNDLRPRPGSTPCGFHFKFLRRNDPSLRGEDFFRQHAMHFRVRVKASVLDDGALEIQIEGLSQRGEDNAAGRNAKQHQMIHAFCPQNQAQRILRKRRCNAACK